MIASRFKKKRVIILELKIALLLEKISKFCKPLPRSLFRYAFRHLHVHLLIQVSMQESIVDIHLKNMPMSVSCQGKNDPDGSHFHYRGKCFCEINAFTLSITSDNQPCFISLNGAISLKLNFVHPLTTDSLFPGGRSTSVQVLLACKACISDSMALTQSGSRDA